MGPSMKHGAALVSEQASPKKTILKRYKRRRAGTAEKKGGARRQRVGQTRANLSPRGVPMTGFQTTTGGMERCNRPSSAVLYDRRLQREDYGGFTLRLA